MTSFFRMFRNVCIYRLSRDVKLEPEQMISGFGQYAFTPCTSKDMARTGFISPLVEDGEEMGFHSNGFLMVLIRKESRDVPASVIRAEMDKKIHKLESEQGRKLKKTEKDSLKDEVLQTLIPRAFSKYALTPVLFDLEGDRIFVAATPRKAEDALALIRKSLGSLPVVPLTLETPIELTLTGWVKDQQTPAGFTFGERADLKAVLDDGGQAKLIKQDLSSDEVMTMLDAGKLVTRLELDWQKRAGFILDDTGMLSAMKFSDVLMDQNSDIDSDDAAQRSGADILLVGSELCGLTDELVSALGGEAAR